MYCNPRVHLRVCTCTCLITSKAPVVPFKKLKPRSRFTKFHQFRHIKFQREITLERFLGNRLRTGQSKLLTTIFSYAVESPTKVIVLAYVINGIVPKLGYTQLKIGVKN